MYIELRLQCQRNYGSDFVSAGKQNQEKESQQKQRRTHSLYNVKNIKELPIITAADLYGRHAECYVYSVNEIAKSTR